MIARVSKEHLSISGIREAPDVEQASIPDSVLDPDRAEIEILERHWASLKD